MLYSVPLGNLTAERLQKTLMGVVFMGYISTLMNDVQNKYDGASGGSVGMVRSLVSNKGEENGYRDRLENDRRPRD